MITRRTFLKGLTVLLITPALPQLAFQVGEYEERESLADLIDKAEPGQVILIGAGSYYSDRPLIVPRGCILLGNDIDCVVRGSPHHLIEALPGSVVRIENSSIRSECGTKEIKNLVSGGHV